MKLHLPCKLLAAVLACLCAAGSFTLGAESISINFGSTQDSSAGTIGDTATAGLEAVQGQYWTQVSGSSGSDQAVKVYNGSDAAPQSTFTTVSWSSSNEWNGKLANLTTGDSHMLKGYLDDGANGGNGATIDVKNLDFLFYDVYIYANTDTASSKDKPVGYAAKSINGTTYTFKDGKTTTGDETWGDTGTDGKSGEAADSLEVNAELGINALCVKGQTGGNLSISGGAKNSDTTIRGCIAGIQVVDATAEHLWMATGSDGSYTYSLNGEEAKTLDAVLATGGEKYLGFTNGQDIDFGETAITLDGIHASAAATAADKTVTVSGSNLQIGTLFAKSGAILDLKGTLTDDSNVTIGGFGQVIFSTAQELGDLTLNGNLHIAAGTTSTITGSYTHNAGTLTGGEGAHLYASYDGGKTLANGTMSVAAAGAARYELLGAADNEVNLIAQGGESVAVTSSGGTLTVGGVGAVTLSALTLNGGTTLLQAGDEATLTSTELPQSQMHGKNLTVGKGVELNYAKLDLGTSTLTLQEGGHIKTGGVIASNGWSGRTSIFQINGGLFEVTGEDGDVTNGVYFKKGSIRFSHWKGSTELNVNGGEFRALKAVVGTGDDGHTDIRITQGEMNVLGIVSPGTNATKSTLTMTSGSIHIGSKGIWDETGKGDGADKNDYLKVTLTGGTLGALAGDGEGWSSALNMAMGGITINTSAYDAVAKTYSATAGKVITLTGTLTIDKTVSVQGAGTLKLGGDLDMDAALDNSGTVEFASGAKLLPNAGLFTRLSASGDTLTYGMTVFKGTGTYTNVQNLSVQEGFSVSFDAECHTGTVSMQSTALAYSGSELAWVEGAEGFVTASGGVDDTFGLLDAVTFIGDTVATLGADVIAGDLEVAEGASLKLIENGHSLDPVSWTVKGDLIIGGTSSGSAMAAPSYLGGRELTLADTGRVVLALGQPTNRERNNFDALHEVYSGRLTLADGRYQVTDNSPVWESGLSVEDDTQLVIAGNYSGDISLLGGGIIDGTNDSDNDMEGALKFNNGASASGTITISKDTTRNISGATITTWGWSAGSSSQDLGTLTGNVVLDGLLTKNGHGTLVLAPGAGKSVTGTGGIKVELGVLQMADISVYTAGIINVGAAGTLKLTSANRNADMGTLHAEAGGVVAVAFNSTDYENDNVHIDENGITLGSDFKGTLRVTGGKLVAGSVLGNASRVELAGGTLVFNKMPRKDNAVLDKEFATTLHIASGQTGTIETYGTVAGGKAENGIVLDTLTHDNTVSALTGGGTLVKTNTGKLTIGDASGFTGSIQISGEAGELAINTGSGSNAVDGAQATSYGYWKMTGNKVTLEGSGEHVIKGFALSAEGLLATTFTIAEGATLVVANTSTTADIRSSEDGSFQVSNYSAGNTLNIEGTLISNAGISSRDGSAAINVTGVLQMNNGLLFTTWGGEKDEGGSAAVNIKDGGTLVLGNRDETLLPNTNKTTTNTLEDGATLTILEDADTVTIGDAFTYGAASGETKGVDFKAAEEQTLVYTGSTATAKRINATGNGEVQLAGEHGIANGTTTYTVEDSTKLVFGTEGATSTITALPLPKDTRATTITGTVAADGTLTNGTLTADYGEHAHTSEFKLGANSAVVNEGSGAFTIKAGADEVAAVHAKNGAIYVETDSGLKVRDVTLAGQHSLSVTNSDGNDSADLEVSGSLTALGGGGLMASSLTIGSNATLVLGAALQVVGNQGCATALTFDKGATLDITQMEIGPVSSTPITLIQTYGTMTVTGLEHVKVLPGYELAVQTIEYANCLVLQAEQASGDFNVTGATYEDGLLTFQTDISGYIAGNVNISCSTAIDLVGIMGADYESTEGVQVSLRDVNGNLLGFNDVTQLTINGYDGFDPTSGFDMDATTAALKDSVANAFGNYYAPSFAASIPEPATATLSLLALAALAARRRRK